MSVNEQQLLRSLHMGCGIPLQACAELRAMSPSPSTVNKDRKPGNQQRRKKG